MNISKFIKLSELYGNKAAAQYMFKKSGLFKGELLLFPPPYLIENIKKELKKKSGKLNDFTVRFSKKNQINMPRGFFKTYNEAMTFIEQNIDNYNDACIIIHRVIMPIFSYELYWDDETFFVQIQPGIWEVDNTYPPDIMLKTGENVKLYSYSEAKTCRTIDENFKFKLKRTSPLSFDFLKSRYLDITNLKGTLEPFKTIFNPLFCHYIEDINGECQFLNARRTSKLKMNDTLDEISVFHEVRSLKDIDIWDGKKPILFAINSKRDNDSEIIQAAQIFAGQKVYIRYGLLSHPAILLRECNVKVEQVFSVYKTKLIKIENELSR